MEPVTFEEPVEYDPTVAKDGEDDAPMRFNNPRFRRIGRQEMMSCWRQYTIFIIGSAIVALCTVTTITLLSEAANALLANVALMCWAGAVPFSFVLHIVTRTLVRTLRKKRALARGKRVDGDRSLIVDDVLFDAEDGGGAAAARRLQRMVSAMYLDPAEIALQLNAPAPAPAPAKKKKGLGAGVLGGLTRRGSAVTDSKRRSSQPTPKGKAPAAAPAPAPAAAPILADTKTASKRPSISV